MLPLREKADHGGGDRNQAIPITARPSHKMNNRTVRGRPPDHQKGGSVRRNRRVVRAIAVTRRFFLIFSKDPFTAAWSGKEAVHATSRHFRPDPLASGKESHPGFPATKKAGASPPSMRGTHRPEFFRVLPHHSARYRSTSASSTRHPIPGRSGRRTVPPCRICGPSLTGSSFRKKGPFRSTGVSIPK